MKIAVFLLVALLALPGAAMADAGDDIALWTDLQNRESSQPFSRYARFLTTHADWPALGRIRAEAERRLDSRVPPAVVLAFFAEEPPITLQGAYAYAAALGKGAKATEALRNFWREGAMTLSEQRDFQAAYGALLTPADTAKRADGLVWQGDLDEAKALLPLLTQADRAVLEARLAVRQQSPKASALVAAADRKSEGLAFELARSKRQVDDYEGAAAALAGIKPASGEARRWWRERDGIARGLLRAGEPRKAYLVAAEHGFSPDDRVPYGMAEWLAGWIALRHLKQPQQALPHFERVYRHSQSINMLSRGAYWLGRAHSAAGNAAEAEKWLGKAAAFGTTFYAQMAAVKLYDSKGGVNVEVKPAPQLNTAERAAFTQRSVVAAALWLQANGQRDRATDFFRHIMQVLETERDYVLLMDAAQRAGRPDMAAFAARLAGREGFSTGNALAYPLLSRLPSAPEQALIHAIIRQESVFDVRATSSAGARGLMQLMPATAKDTARRQGVPFNTARLFEPAYNTQLGSAYLQRRIDNFAGSYVLAIAAYNAGAGNVCNWIGCDAGEDGRREAVQNWLSAMAAPEDVADWIESIPFEETRTYVQYVLANLAIYRARLANGQARLKLGNDLLRFVPE